MPVWSGAEGGTQGAVCRCAGCGVPGGPDGLCKQHRAAQMTLRRQTVGSPHSVASSSQPNFGAESRSLSAAEISELPLAWENAAA